MFETLVIVNFDSAGICSWRRSNDILGRRLLVRNVAKKTLGREPDFCGERSENHSALLAEVGISTLLWRPVYEGAHRKKEWVDTKPVKS